MHLLEEVKQFAPQELKSVPEAEKKKKINVSENEIGSDYSYSTAKTADLAIFTANGILTLTHSNS